MLCGLIVQFFGMECFTELLSGTLRKYLECVYREQNTTRGLKRKEDTPRNQIQVEN